MSRRWPALYGLIAVLLATGAFVALRLPSSIFPSVTFPIVKVIVEAGESPAARMMPTVTRPVEEAIQRVPGTRLVRSTTSRGSSELTAEFAWGTDMKEALQRVWAEMARIRPELPPGTRIDVEWMNPASFPILGYALTSETRSQADLLQLAEFTLKPALVAISGVSEIQIQGGRRREFQVWLDPAKLRGRKLAVADVLAAIHDNHTVLSAGLVEQNHELYLTLVDGQAYGVDELSRLSVPVAGGPPATLAELGRVQVADEVSYVRTTADGDSAVLVNLIRQPTANTIAIAGGVDRLFRQRPDLLPEGVRWTPFYDQASFVAASVKGTRDAIFIGILLAALVLFVFLRKVRLTLIAVAVVPVTAGIVMLGLGVSGQTINLMTLAGIAAAIGLIADDAIVMVENIDRHHGEEGSVDSAERGLRDILGALVGSSLSTTVILIPFMFLPGVIGAFFRPLALTMALALAVSFLLTLVAVPISVHRFGFGRRTRERRKDGGRQHGGRQRSRRRLNEGGRLRRVGRRLSAAGSRSYGRTIAWMLDHPVLPVLLTIGLLWVVTLEYGRIGTDFLPAMDEGSVILDYWTPPGTSLTDTDGMLREVEKVIESVPDVEGYSRRTGTQLGFFVTEPNRGDYVINLKPRRLRRPVELVIAELRSRIAAAEPAVHTDFGQLMEDEIGDLTGGTPQPIDVKIFGSDPVLLQKKARQTADILAGVSGVEDVFDGIVIAGPALTVRVNSRRAARYGLTTRDIQETVKPAVTGSVLGQVRVGDRMYDLRVFTEPPTSLAELRIRSRTEPMALIPLAEVAEIGTGDPEAEIDREDLQTFVGVTARLSGRDLGGAIAEIRSKLARDLTLAPGMSIRFSGLYEQQQKSFRGLLYILIAGLVLVSIVVLFEFADWRAPVVTTLCAGCSLAGVLLALLLTGQTLNVTSYVGAIMMVGIVGENAIFVINEGHRQLSRGLPVREAWIEASRIRLRPVAMTVLATAFALAPLALAIGEGSQLMQPLALAVIGGFLLSGPIVLLLLPGLYGLLDPAGRLGG